MLSFALHGVAHAHGEPPEIVGVASADGQGPNVLLLNEGLAFRHGGHFTYVCPSLWGDTDIREFGSPHAHGDGITTWIVGVDAVYTLREGALMPLPRAPIDESAVVSMLEVHDDLYALLLTLDGSELVPVRREAPSLWASPTLWPTVAAHGEGFVLARVEEGIELLWLDGEGAEVERRTVELPGQLAGVAVRSLGGADDQLYVSFLDGADYVLGEVALDELSFHEHARSEMPIHGPERAQDGTAFIAHDDKLVRLGPESAEIVETERDVTCLGRWRELPYVCTGSAVHVLTPDGAGETLHELVGLHGPTRIPEEAQPQCGFQWQLFSNDLERSGLAPVSADQVAADAGPGAPASGAQDAAASSMSMPAPDEGPERRVDAGDTGGGGSGDCRVSRTRGTRTVLPAWLVIACCMALWRRPVRLHRAS